MASDTKKVQTLINAVADTVVQARSITAIRALYTQHNPSIQDTPIQGNGAAINTWLNKLEAILSEPIADLFVASKVETHRGNAL